MEDAAGAPAGDDGLLDATEAAERLGVKRETLYAYVSRGQLRRHPSSHGRGSRFDPADLDRLAERRASGRGPRRPSHTPEVVITSAVTTIDDHRIRFRGHDVGQLVADASFEAVAELLWTGRLARPPSWRAPRALVEAVAAVGERLPRGIGPADRLRVATAVAAAADPLRVDLRPEAVAATGRALLATLAGALGEGAAPQAPAGQATAGQAAAGDATAGQVVEEETVAQRATASLGARARWAAATEAALVLLADHELASSTLAARVAASTRADPYHVVLAGLAVVSGPLHGSASTLVARLLRDAAADGFAVALASWLRQWGHVPGFGHPLYPRGDPRAGLLLERVRAAAGPDHPAMATVEAVLAAMTGRAAANVDFALGALVFVGDLPPGAGEALFALARTAGWIAHALEEYAEPALRFRVRTVDRNAARGRDDNPTA